MLPAPTVTVSFRFNMAKLPGQGEDCDPILSDGSDLSLVGVFDGMGGAGGTVYQTPDGPRTGAYLASRVARDAVERRIIGSTWPTTGLNGPAAADELKGAAERALIDRLVD